MCFNGLNYLFITLCVFHTLCARFSFLIDDASEVQSALDLWSLGSSKNAEPSSLELC